MISSRVMGWKPSDKASGVGAAAADATRAMRIVEMAAKLFIVDVVKFWHRVDEDTEAGMSLIVVLAVVICRGMSLAFIVAPVAFFPHCAGLERPDGCT